MSEAAAPWVVVTGAAGGIGRALVQVFEQDGWQVLSVDRQPLARRHHVQADVADLADPASSAHQALLGRLRGHTQGRCKAVVANAAWQVVKPVQSLSAGDWQETLLVNVLSPFWLAMGFADELAANQGSFLAISSIHEKLTKPGFVAYSTSKAALSAMVRAMAVELGSQVRCNAICPAAIATPMLLAGFEAHPDELSRLEAFHPAGRLGQPEEVARAALFVCSGAASFMNGAMLELTGGIGARLHDPV